MFFVHHAQKIPNEGEYVKLCVLNNEKKVNAAEAIFRKYFANVVVL